ncbi:hypothetical protein ccrud_01215 [Corynebacterium crudilactis]|uniref:Uncharacterized protein n=2 Tax=Corynebacterium crudilactis TaxID=1652495 RepID=A0A172QQM6_9CORY|nr:hypothetical protein ccrud_01215 [Corynebacterium crudilactis]
MHPHYSQAMSIPIFYAIAVSVLVGVSILRKQSGPERVFPWFWVFFPLLLASIAGLFAEIKALSYVPYGWTMSDPAIYSDEVQPDFFTSYNTSAMLLVVYVVTLVVGVIGSVWSWKKQRI